MSSKNKEKVLILAAHPDDEVLGCGGVIQKHISLGDKVFVCIITDGSSSQYADDSAMSKQKRNECQAANSILGVHKLIRLDLPDMRLDSIPHIELNQKIEEVFIQTRPSIVYTHSVSDRNLDHVRIADSVQVVAKPGRPYLKKVFAYEVLSSSQWPSIVLFDPNTFIDISPYLENKIKALLVYQTEIRPYPHPRSPEGVRILAQYRGLQADMKAAEAFKLLVNY